jgi:thiamine-monophosphate kinase
LAASWSLTPEEGAHLVARYDRPQPRLALRQALLAHARAAMDVSDGLVKDLSRMCAASQSGNPLGAILEAARLPLSPAATKAIAADPGLTRAALAWGDDYEVLAAVPPHAARAFADQALADGCPVCEIGWITAQPGVHVVGTDGQPIALARTGWDHF